MDNKESIREELERLYGGGAADAEPTPQSKDSEDKDTTTGTSLREELNNLYGDNTETTKTETAEDRKPLLDRMALTSSLRDMTTGEGLKRTHKKIENAIVSNPMHLYNYLSEDEEGNSNRGEALRKNIEQNYTSEDDGAFVKAKYDTASKMVDMLPAANDMGDIEIDGYTYPRARVVQTMADVVEETMHPTLMKSNKVYRDNFSIATYGKNFNDYLRERLLALDHSLSKMQQDVNRYVKEDVDAISSETPIYARGMAGGIDPVIAAAIVTNEKSGGRAIRDTRDKIRSIIDDDFGSGFNESFDWGSMASMGLNDIIAGAELNAVLNKAKDGKELSEREQTVYDVWAINQELDDLRDITGRSGWNSIGSGVGVSAEFAPSMMLGTGLLGGGVKLTSLGVKAGFRAAKNAAQKGVMNGIKRGLIETAKVAGRAAANVTRAEAVGIISAPLTPTTWARYAEKRAEQYALNGDKVEYKPTEAWKDVADVMIEQANEVAGELTGGRIADVIGSSAKVFGRTLRLDRIADKIGISADSRTFLGLRKPAYIREFQRNIGFAGPIAEPLSEVWGDVASNIMKGAITGNSDYSQLATPDYWSQVIGVSTIYGGAVSLATTPASIMEYKRSGIYGVAKARQKSLSQIGDDKLRNEMLSISSIEDMDEAARELANISWKDYKRTDVASAMEFIRADYMEKVMLGDAKENVRMSQFEPIALSTSSLVYCGEDGATPTDEIISIDTDMGRLVVRKGVIDTGFDNMLECIDANGKVIPVHSSKIKGVYKHSLQEELAANYEKMFGVQIEVDRQNEIVENFKAIKKPTAKDVNIAMSQFGVSERANGDVVTLTDGRTGVINSSMGDGTYAVAVSDYQGTQLLSVPFYDILAEDAKIKDAQMLGYAERMANNIDEYVAGERYEVTKEEKAEVAKETETAETTTRNGITEGDVVATKDGRQGRVIAINDDGTYTIDENVDNISNDLDAAMPSVINESDITTGEEMPVDDIAEETMSAEEDIEATPIEEMENIPTLEDGTIDYNAISDPKVYAKHFANDMGGNEAASAQMASIITATQKEIDDLTAKKEASADPNEAVRNAKAIAERKQRLAFYNEVMNILSPTPSPEVTTVETTTEQPKATTEVYGIVPNMHSAKLEESLAKVVDAMAKSLGLRVTFTTGLKGNAEIVGNEVRIDWGHRTEAISFLAGHEFTHRMQDLSPEAYEEFKKSVKEYLGEDEWNRRMVAQARKYRYNRVRYTKELLEDECIADFAGQLVEGKDVFANYVNKNKENKGLLSVIADVLRAIRDFIFNADAEAAKPLNATINSLESLIAESQAAQSKMTENTPTAEQTSQSEDQQSRVRHFLSNPPTFYSNAQYAVQNIKQEKATPEQWLKMIEKNGGLKAGEDKWLGLSDWLKASTAKTLTKDEVLQYIAENDIQIEEVVYYDKERFSSYDITESDEFSNLLTELTDYDEDENSSFNVERFRELQEQDKDFAEGFELDYWEESIEVNDPVAAARYLGLMQGNGEIIHRTRLDYTTQGLSNKREIALVVPTIEPYNAHDEIHFGDAGEGRAVAWIRFGEAEVPKAVPMVQRVDEFEAPYTNVNGKEVYRPKDSSRYTGDFVVYGKLKTGEYAYVVYIKDKQIPVAHNSLEEARNAMNEYYEANPRMITRYDKVLVIDEIQSKRHQDGREKGYRDESELVRLEEAKEALREATREFGEYRDALKEKYDYNSIEGSPVTRARAFMAMMTEQERAKFEELNNKVREAEMIQAAAHEPQLRMEDIIFTESDGIIEGRYGDLTARFVEGTSREAIRQDLQGQMRQQRINDVTKRVPVAPFEKNWAELAFKRMLRYAAENGYGYVAWTTGDQQADRYDIGSVVKDIVSYDTKDADGNPIKKTKFRMNNMGTYNIATNVEGVIVKGDGEMKEGMRLSDITGKALAEKIMNGEGEDVMVFENDKDIEAKSLEGEELHIGNEGMKAFYDQMLPSFVKKYTKKWGAEVKDITMPYLEENNTMHAVNVTDSMREGVMQGQPKFYLAGTEVGFILENYDDIQDIATAVEAVVKRYPNETGMLANALSDYRQNANEDEFIQGLRTFAKYFGDKQERDRSEDKATIEETFGGIWIEDTEEFAKFAKAVNNNPFEEDGEGIAYTDNYFFMYYRSKDGQAIPFFSVYMNEYESQDIVKEVKDWWNNESKRDIRAWANWFNARSWNIEGESNWLSGPNKDFSVAREDSRLGGELFRKGRYFDNPELYSKVKRADSASTGRGRVRHSLITPEMDASYMDAVNNGDMETAQRMVMEAAKIAGYDTDTSYQGSLAFNGAAPDANAYFETKEERKEAWNNDDYDGTMSLGDYADNAIDTNDLEWQLTDRGNYRRAEDYTKESIDNINKAIKDGSHKIPIYRAVPNNVEESSVRNGDWVTPSRKYAEFHIGLQDWESGRIIEQEVDIDNLWWNGDDINEWGYDDGSNYGYRNTANSRKLLDPVTYDDAGNVIPLSERFNPNKEDIRYALSEETMPFFDEGVSEETDGIEPQRGVITSEEQVRIYLRHKHLKAKQNIRKKYRIFRNAATLDYNERMAERRAKVRSMRTYASKVEYILGEQIEQTLPYEHQAYAKIARGEIKMPWEALAKELGLKKGEKRMYASITRGADKDTTFDSVVHQWWEELDGYEKGIDTQDLRNALISALSTAPSSTKALTELSEIYNREKERYIELVDDYDRMEEQELIEEDARNASDMERLANDPTSVVAEYTRNASFFNQLEVVDATIMEIRTRLEKTKMMRNHRTKQEYYRTLIDTIAELKQSVKNIITSETIDNLNRNELRRLVDKIDKARSKADIDSVLNDIDAVMLAALIKAQLKNANRMLKLKLPNGMFAEEWVNTQVREGRMSRADADAMLREQWKGRNASGVSVAKWVDARTAEVLDRLSRRVASKMALGDKEFSSEREIEEIANRIAELEDKKIDTERGELPAAEGFTEKDAIELDVLSLYEKFLAADVLRKDVADLMDIRSEIEQHYYGIEGKEAVRDVHLEANQQEINDINRQRKELLEEFNNSLLSLLRDGREALAQFRREQEGHKAMVVNMALDAIGKDARLVKTQPKWNEKMQARLRATVNAPYYTFQTVLKEIDHLSPNGEGRFYNYFMESWRDANNAMIDKHASHVETVAYAMARILKVKGRNAADVIQSIINKSDETPLLAITYGGDDAMSGAKRETKVLTLSNALYLMAMWRQTQYRDSMMYHGFTEQMYRQVEAAVRGVGEEYITFIDWVNETLLPNTRLEYNKVHKEMFGTSMAEEKNYFPARLVGTVEKGAIDFNEAGELPSTITGAVINRVRNRNMIDLNVNYFKILMSHLQEMDQWSSFAPLIRDLNYLAANNKFRDMCNSYMCGVNADRGGAGSLFTYFKLTSAIAANCYTPPKVNPVESTILALTRGWAGANISWRFSTALKQLASSPVFAAYTTDPRCLALWVKNSAVTFARQKATLEWAMRVSPMFKKRWEGKFAGMDILDSKVKENGEYSNISVWNQTKVGRGVAKFDDALHKFATDLGMTPNAFIDAMTIANGIKTIYEYEISKWKRQNKGKEVPRNVERKAIMKAEIAFNATQQSGEGAFISEWQAERGIMRALSTYQNSAYGFHRLRLTAANELWRQINNEEYKERLIEEYGEVEAKAILKDARKTAYAQLMQGSIGEFIFAMMGGAGAVPLFSLLGGDDDEGESWDLFKDAMAGALLNISTGGYALGSLLNSALSGYEVTLFTAGEELIKDVKELFSTPSLYKALEILGTYRYGVDLQTLTNIVTGIDGLIDKASYDDGGAEAVMKILNIPRTQIDMVAGKRKDGETVQEYVTRRLRTEAIGAIPEVDAEGNIIADDEYWDKFYTPRKSYAQKFRKDFETAYRRDVITNIAGVDAYRRYLELEDEYKAVVEAIGWTPDKKPSPEMYKKIVTMGGFDDATYRALFPLQNEVAFKAKKTENFAGTEDNYYELLEQMMESKQKLIDKYNEL